MFQGYRFICIGEKAREIESDLRELIHHGGGSLETFDVHSGVAKLHKALTRSQANLTLPAILRDKRIINNNKHPFTNYLATVGL